MATKSVSAISKLHKIIFATPKYQTISISHYSSNQQAEDNDAMTLGVPKPNNNNNNKDNIIPTKEDNHYKHPKTTPSKLQTPGVNSPIDPHFQQKRAKSTKPNSNTNNNNNLCCAGLDGTPWPEEESVSREQQEVDDKEYFKEHKASPLSKIEVGDTRKPLAKVMDGTTDGYFGGEKVMTWRPEQVDTAEESLLRAARMFREAAARGVPEWPHSRRLRELRGEDW